jgi:hypothetical protein
MTEEEQLPDDEIRRLKSWFESWSDREGETMIYHDDIEGALEGIDAALVGKAHVWRAGKFRWVPVYDWHKLVAIVYKNTDMDPVSFVESAFVNKYNGHMTPIINVAPTRDAHLTREPEESDAEYDPYDPSSVDEEDDYEDKEGE